MPSGTTRSSPRHQTKFRITTILMADTPEKEDDKVVTDPADPSNADPQKKQPAADGGEGGEGSGHRKNDEIMIPKSRFDEEVDKRRKLEGDLEDFRKRMTEVGDTLSGRDKTAVVDEKVDQLSKKYNVSPDFISDIMSAAEERAGKRIDALHAPLKASQAETQYERELRTLQDSHPEAEHLAPEDRKKLREMAFDPKYSRTPLEDIYKVLMFGRTAPKKKTVEGARSGGGRPNADEFPDISSMSLEEFEKFSDRLGKEGR